MLVAAIVGAGCAARTDQVGSDASDALTAQFEERVERYVELRERAIAGMTPLETTAEPARIKGYQDTLAARIRVARDSARHGDIFTPDIRVRFRELLAHEVKGEQGRDIRATLRDDAPAPDAVPLEVNGAYPSGTPFPTTPSPLLTTLPILPRGLEYRIIGRDLILLDQPANVIVDYLRNAIPAQPASTAR